MIKAYIKSLDKKILLLMLFALIASPTLCGINTYTVCLIYSHYLCIYLNNLYLMLMYQQVDKLNLLNDLITVRIGTTKYYIYSLLFFLWIHTNRKRFINSFLYDYQCHCDLYRKFNYLYATWK
jgi:hypothetical protein